jgi:DNA-binding LytR/AlgR family response regulator
MSERFYFYHERRKLICIDLHDILYLEASGNYTKFKGKAETHIVRTTLERALELLPEEVVFRISKSYALCAYNVKEFDKSRAWFKKGGEPDIEFTPSRNHYEQAVLKLNILDRDFGEWIEIPMEE